MDGKVFDRFRESLLEQRQNIEEWVENTSPEERQIRLGPVQEDAVQKHLEVLIPRSRKPKIRR